MIKNALQDFNIDIVSTEKFHEVPTQPAPLWSLIDLPNQQHSKLDLQSLADTRRAAFLPFEDRYQLEVCISRGSLNEYNITPQFVKTLADLAHKDSRRARSILEYVTEQDKRVYEPETIFADQDALSYSPNARIPAYCAYTRKATITPSTIIFSSPTVETTNRVTRHYARENDDGRFLRVQFTDEEFEVGAVSLKCLFIANT